MLDAVISEKKAFIKWGLAIASVIIVYMIIPENESITYEMRMFIAVTLFAIELMAMDFRFNVAWFIFSFGCCTCQYCVFLLD